jgi:hypothetical protein
MKRHLLKDVKSKKLNNMADETTYTQGCQKLNAIVAAMATKLLVHKEIEKRLKLVSDCKDLDPEKILEYVSGIETTIKNMDSSVPELQGFMLSRRYIDNLSATLAKNTDESGKVSVKAEEILKWIEPLVALNAKMTFLASLKS